MSRPCDMSRQSTQTRNPVIHMAGRPATRSPAGTVPRQMGISTENGGRREGPDESRGSRTEQEEEHQRPLTRFQMLRFCAKPYLCALAPSLACANVWSSLPVHRLLLHLMVPL